MTWYRWEAQARLEDGMREGGVGGRAVQLVTVCLRDGSGAASDERDGPVERPPVVCHLRPSEARVLAFCLHELADLADRRTEGWE